MKKILGISILLVLLVTSCGRPAAEHSSDQHPEELKKIFEAHGGYGQWQKMDKLSYSISDDEKHLISLKDRRARIDSDKGSMGFDGQKVWISPDSADLRNPHMYYNLYFYFFAMPFVLGDPGINYEQVAPKEFKGKLFNGLKISYDGGVGNSPEDNYIVYYDPETYQMEWLMYTFTYTSQESNDDYRLIKYDRWGTYNGIKLPVSLQWYTFAEDEVGDVRKEMKFERVILASTPPDESEFEVPEGGKIVSP